MAVASRTPTPHVATAFMKKLGAATAASTALHDGCPSSQWVERLQCFCMAAGDICPTICIKH